MKTYDPNQVVASFGGRTLGGFVKGSFIEIERDEDAYNYTSGVNGEGTRSKSISKSGKIHLKLQPTSDSNDVLSAFAAADELNNGGLEPFILKDVSGRTLVSAEQAYIVKYPKIEFDEDVTEREWILQTDNLLIFAGGN
jgi:hypothetical protein